MILNVNEDEILENPSAAQVESAIASLPREHFAILSGADQHYIQTFHDEDGTFQLEYRQGSAEHHYSAAEESISSVDVGKAFASYLKGNADWQSAHTWDKVEFDEDFQGDLTSENAYLINGEEYEKIAVGSERETSVNAEGRCDGCNAVSGQYHEDYCEREECPCCHGRIATCECE